MMHELFHVSFYASRFMAIIMYLVTHILQLGRFNLCFTKVLRATSQTRPRALDHYTSNTHIGGKGGAGPSLLHTTMLEGPTKYVNARWM